MQQTRNINETLIFLLNPPNRLILTNLCNSVYK